MFGRRKKTLDSNAISMVQNYATQLGIERRLSPRVRYPTPHLTCLPSIFFGNHAIDVHDMSIGGTCLLDHAEHLGPSAGVELDLRLIWPNGEKLVPSRIVSRVDIRRHVQFINPPNELVQVIKGAISPGTYAITMRPMIDLSDSHLAIHAKEVWTSLNGECLTFLDDLHVSAELYLNGKIFKFLKDAWPVNKENLPAQPAEVEDIIIFLENIPRPSVGIRILQSQIQTLYFEGRT